MFFSDDDRSPYPFKCFHSSFCHLSGDQRERCERVELVHHLTHASDEVLCQALDGGAHAWAKISSADVRLNRRRGGPCVPR